MAVASEHTDTPTGEVLEEAVLTALDELDAPEAPTDERFEVKDENSADWVLRKLTKARAEWTRVHSMAERQAQAVYEAVQPHVSRIREWEHAEKERINSETAWWESLLARYHRSILADDARRKSIRLPHGILRTRKNPDKWETDDEELIAWAKRNDVDILRIETMVNRGEMKKTFSVTDDGEVVWGGELVPGVKVLPGEVRFTVETEEVPS